MAIWYKPAEPDASAAPSTMAGMLSMLMEGRVAVAYTGSLGTGTPSDAAGVVGPNPVAHRIRIMTSPGLAGMVVASAKVPALNRVTVVLTR
jgi:hypothetical protein